MTHRTLTHLAGLNSGAKKRGRAVALLFSLGLAAAAQAQSVVNFDDIATDYYFNNDGIHLSNTVAAPLPDQYGGLQWNNFYAVDGLRWPEALGQFAAGFQVGLRSPRNEAIVAPTITNSAGGVPTLDPSHTSADISAGAAFGLVSGYFTALYFSDLALAVQGFSGTNLLYDQTFMLQYDRPTFIQFNFDNVTGVHFVSAGGVLGDIYDGVGLPTYAMDDLTIVPAPEPSGLVLFGPGGLGLFGLGWFIRRDKRPARCKFPPPQFP